MIFPDGFPSIRLISATAYALLPDLCIFCFILLKKVKQEYCYFTLTHKNEITVRLFTFIVNKPLR